jgi:hypothetical protein
MVCDTTDSNGKKTTLEEHVARIQNTLRQMGADPEALAEGMSALEPIAAQIKEVAPYFKFSTRAGKATMDPMTKKMRDPLIFESWHGSKGLEDYVPESHNGVEDTTGTSNDSAPTSADNQGASETFNEFEGQEDLDALLEDAKGKNLNGSQAKLEELAVKAGKTQEEVNNATSWEEVIEWIQEGDAGEPDEGTEAEAQAYEPSKGDPVKIEVLKDPKNPKKGSKNIDVEVLTVNKKNKTVTVKSLETGKPIMDSTGKKAKDIEWDSLIIGD